MDKLNAKPFVECLYSQVSDAVICFRNAVRSVYEETLGLVDKYSHT